MPRLTFCSLPKLPGCSIRAAQTNVLRAPRNYFDAGFRQLMGCVRHQTAENLLPRAPRLVCYETRLSRDELAGPNAMLSRRCATAVVSASWWDSGRLEHLVRFCQVYVEYVHEFPEALPLVCWPRAKQFLAIEATPAPWKVILRSFPTPH